MIDKDPSAHCEVGTRWLDVNNMNVFRRTPTMWKYMGISPSRNIIDIVETREFSDISHALDIPTIITSESSI